MATLDFDAKRAERGVAEDHEVVFGGETHVLPAVLPMETLSELGRVIGEATGGSFKMESEDPTAFLAAVPGLLDVFAKALGEWVRKLDQDEFMLIFGLYDLGVTVGEATAS